MKVWAMMAAAIAMFATNGIKAQIPPEAKGDVIGPFNVEFPAGGDGVVKPVPGYAEGERLAPSAGWTLAAWVESARIVAGRAIVAGVGPAAAPASRALALVDGKPALLLGDRLVIGSAPLPVGRWHRLVAVAEAGKIRLLVDGLAVARGIAPPATPIATIVIGPRLPGQPAFAGGVAGLTSIARALDDAELRKIAATPPNDDLVPFENASPTWPLQVRTQYGEAVPQKAWTLPKGIAPPSQPVAMPTPDLPALVADGQGRFTINGWRMAETPGVKAGGAILSMAGFDAARWYPATVPGTALTTLVDRGVYPDPRIGLNNLAIPERLARQDYWYRTQFVVPADQAGKRLELVFNGNNYAAEVWVNGAVVGTIRGAFIRGRFDVTARLIPGRANAIAVRIAPPPHPGIPHEQSMTAGRGENGGMMMVDGPTFGATEGWDWIPGVRDRNTGLWQSVALAATGALTLGDAQVVTTLPNPDNEIANVEISVPVTNHGDRALTAAIRAAFDDVLVDRTVTVAAGATVDIRLTPADYPQLRVRHPKLWWPNGYGDPALHTLHLSAAADGIASDSKDVRFGIRQVTYELSAMDAQGDLDRIEIDLSKARALGTPIIDERHPSLRKVPNGWAPSLFPGAEHSPAVRMIAGDAALSPHLVIRVNGVRIAARGGNMGMDEMMKRVDRARLEPFFRLQREAHMNILRNWMGQSTEEVLYDLADEYGLMILNDFWESTQDNDAEAEDVPLFVANARDVVRRYRNHPSIILWIGRNEGVPQPILQTALQDMVREEDGTRLYKGNSRLVNFAGSGPYNWREPEGYFTEYAKGFAVEIGTPSFPTLEAWQRAIPAPDRWPVNDNWAYHDWHQDRQVSLKSFMDALAMRFGPGTDLVDFERKAQMLEYESYRAIFEGFNAGLWTTNSGRLLWMSHPAWPSAEWQIYSSDYDTHAAFYGTRKGSEPIHIQMNLPDHRLILVNTTRVPLAAVRVRAHVVTLDNRAVATIERTIDVAANATVDVGPLDLANALAAGPVLVRLEARGADATLLSDNFYWLAGTPAGLMALDSMPKVGLGIAATAGSDGAERVVEIDLANPSATPALAAKLTLFDAVGTQILPAYFSDNYVSLLPGETRRVSVRYPADRGTATVRLRGWNVLDRSLAATNGR